MHKIFFVTSNKGKFSEAEKKIKNIEQKSFDYPEIRSENLGEIVVYGIEFLKEKIRKPFFIEDSGLFIDVLNNFPGPFSKYVFNKIGCKGILKLMKNEKNRNAVFKSAIGYYDGETKMFEGICEGRISTRMSGKKGFGYDPIFIPKNSDKTFAQMDIGEKNIYSHRGNALTKLVKHIQKS
ncbi:MAG: XTP/dITP diphosphatase [Thermoplasmatales archaeon]|nr:XTP/dITP diphosphatase [Thermoplasmatales archaeon]